MSSGFHPQTDGQTERMNRTIQQIMRFYVLPNQCDWDIGLPLIAFALNTSFNKSTMSTPLELLLGYTPASPYERSLNMTPETRKMNKEQYLVHMQTLWKKAKLAIEMARSRMVDYDSGHRKLFTFERSERVWLSTKHLNLKVKSRRLQPRYVGPFIIENVINPVTYKLELPASMKCHNVFHVSELAPVNPDTRFGPEPTTYEVDGETEYLVDAILDHRVRQRKTKHTHTAYYEYLTSWVGYGPEANEWLTESHFAGASGTDINTILEDYKLRHRLSDPISDSALSSEPRTKRRKVTT